MEWTDFLLFLSAGYLIYYGILMGLDLIKARRIAGVAGGEDILEFTEETETTVIEDTEEPIQEEPSSPAVAEGSEENIQQRENEEDLPLYGENVNVSTGGVFRIVDLFRLAHDETIEVKKKLVYQ